MSQPALSEVPEPRPGPLDRATRRTIGALRQTPWLVYVKRPFGSAKRLFQYLGRYTHRVGLSNQRLVAVTDDAVTFRTKDGRTATLHPEDFLRRLLSHVLPIGFVKIRHSGLFASRQVSTSLPIAQQLLANRAPIEHRQTPSSLAILLQRLTGIDITRCPRCDQSLDRRVLTLYAGRLAVDLAALVLPLAAPTRLSTHARSRRPPRCPGRRAVAGSWRP